MKVHCLPTGSPAYSVRHFGKKDFVASHLHEWACLKKAGDPRVKGIDHFNDLPRGRVEIHDFKAMIYLNPVLNQPEIISKIMNEFGLNEEIQGLRGIRVINDLSNHYRVEQ